LVKAQIGTAQTEIGWLKPKLGFNQPDFGGLSPIWAEASKMTPNQSPQTNVNRNIRLPHPSQHLLSQIILMLSHQDITIYQRINFIFLLSQKSQSNGLECGMSKI